MNSATTGFRILGYADHFSVQPGQRLRVMVSTQYASYRADVVRLGVAEPTPLDFRGVGTYLGRLQETHSGSYVRVHRRPAPERWSRGITVQACIFPTRPTAGHEQGIVSCWSPTERAGWRISLDGEGNLSVHLGDGVGNVTEARADNPLRSRVWYFIAFSLDPTSDRLRIWKQELGRWNHALPPEIAEARLERGLKMTADAPMLIGAGHELKDVEGRPFGRDLFWGKIEDPAVFSRPLSSSELDVLRDTRSPTQVAGESVVGAWNFAVDALSSRVADASGNGMDGVAVNMPMRAATGSRWKADAQRFLDDPSGYSAIHFHPDDVEDARWSPDFEIEVPASARSGVYGITLGCDEQRYCIPFFVTPAGSGERERIAFLAPTYTYLAYANDHMWQRTDVASGALWPTERSERPDPADVYVAEHPELGLSLYDEHADGSGCCYASRMRPILNFRDDYRYWQTDAPRHLSADLLLLEWLERRGFRHDVLTDEELHAVGAAALQPYAVIVTGSHPEYWTAPMMEALHQYADRGGKLVYLGGNGFYWVTSVGPERPHVIEVRRGNAGSRNWSSAPGECYHSTTGEFGGLWRHRGIPPQTLVGVGFTAVGCMGASGYKRQPDSFDPSVAFIFDGVGADEVIGGFGRVLGGAAGDEMDRMDPLLGSPPSTLLLASSFDHNQSYQLCIEEMNQTVPDHDGTTDPRVRADMVYVPREQGGAVFSVGSINWVGSLGFNGDENNVSRITENVLRRFSCLDNDSMSSHNDANWGRTRAEAL
jgi:N,N-dimethylformamidase